ncbi:hypothetical protein SBOR_7128 [Sclerotinia borealis F-4128]|uniref:Sm domain-containing protein n=1 Tax=Sclerotinia borealis (strain F-4128) TaxID=1432307 RepID=W9CD46_SCLBF|nr:hypothetical protein SBOR_7128 [Sclerotinia borealis F-4128]
MITLTPSPADTAPESQSPALQQARTYLHSLLNKILLVHTTDNRMFRGEFKCTDSDLNIILSEVYEYRIPPSILESPATSPPSTSTSTTTSTSTVNPHLDHSTSPPPAPRSPTDPSQPLTSTPTPLSPPTLHPRWLGLVVVPGAHITRIELEQFSSQARGPRSTTATSTGTTTTTTTTTSTSSSDPLAKREISISI